MYFRTCIVNMYIYIYIYKHISRPMEKHKYFKTRVSICVPAVAVVDTRQLLCVSVRLNIYILNALGQDEVFTPWIIWMSTCVGDVWVSLEYVYICFIFVPLNAIARTFQHTFFRNAMPDYVYVDIWISILILSHIAVYSFCLYMFQCIYIKKCMM